MIAPQTHLKQFDRTLVDYLVAPVLTQFHWLQIKKKIETIIKKETQLNKKKKWTKNFVLTYMILELHKLSLRQKLWKGTSFFR